jgi:tetratricopeptide (TPR) repeat protein
MPNPRHIPETFSLLGEPLYPTPINLWLPKTPKEYDEKLVELHEKRDKAHIDWRDAPNDPEKLLWYARRTEIVGNFNEACALYSEGIRRWPDDPRFPRFRGHRFAILRRLDLAVPDLEKAAKMIEGKRDEPEIYASGGPSPEKLGFSSFHWNVWYHLGFVKFAAGDFEGAAEAYRRCMKTCDTRESEVATAFWLTLPLARLHKQTEEAKILNEVKENETLVEVNDYYETLLMYKGATTPERLLEKARSEGKTRFITRAYAIGNYYLIHESDNPQNTEKATKIFEEIHATGEWSAGIHLLAEVELLRLQEE